MAKRKTIPRTIPHCASGFNIITKPIGPICNIRCDYCFYLDKELLFPGKNRSDFAMSDEILKSYVKQYINSQPLEMKEVNFIWQGGEPTLLGLDFFERALGYQKKFKRSGMTVTNSLQTNGTLMTEDKARFFADNDFLLGISIDGPEALHNKYRKDREGIGSFAKVMAGLEMIKKHNIRFNTLTVVQEDNSRHPSSVYRFLRDIGSRYMQFIPIVESGGDVSLVSERTVSAKAWGTFLCTVFDEWIQRDIGEVFVGHFDLLLALHAGFPSTMCVHSKECGRALAMEHNGDIYSCDHFVKPPHYLGNILKEGMVKSVDSEQQRRFGEDKSRLLPTECRDCEYLGLCFGGCPKNRFLAGSGGGLNWLCQGYKEFYRHTYSTFWAMKKALENGHQASDYLSFLFR